MAESIAIRERDNHMSVYRAKLLELLSVEKEHNQSYLKIKLSYDQEIELFWEIDNHTADHLVEIVEFQGSHKFRLSLHSSWNPIKEQHESYVTKTYRNHSEKIYFSCSEEYVSALQSVKYAGDISQMLALPFLSSNLPTETVKPEHAEVQMNEKKSKRGYHRTALATMISVIFLILSGSSGYFYFNNTVFGEQVHDTRDRAEKDADFSEKEIAVTSVQRETTLDSKVEHRIPYKELLDVVTFNLPEGNVALTFDDGPSKYSKQIADILKEYQVGGTFFYVGQNVKKHPDVVQYIHSNGYSIGSHSMQHVNFKRLSYKEQQRDLLKTKELIEGITSEPSVLFRPPYGAYDKKTTALMKNYNHKMVLWDIDPEDWKGHSSNKIFHHVRNSDPSGSIILLHESQEVVDALPKIIEYLQKQNLQIVSLK